MTGEIRDVRRVGDDGEWEVRKVYLLDGKEVPEGEFLAAFPDRQMVEKGKGPHFALAINDAHPLRSEALACHPKQIAAVRARNAKHGLNIPYDRHGRPVFTDAGQRRKLMKIEGVRQQNSYYGA